jgi:hypothetical protein
VDIVDSIPPQKPFLLQEPYAKCMLAHSSFVNVVDILTTTALQHNTATLALRVYKQELGYDTAAAVRCTRAYLDKSV